MRNVLLCLALAGCATAPRPPAAPQTAVSAGGPDEGTVAVVRPIGAAAAETPRAGMLAAMGFAPAAAPAARPLAEIIVRTDAGETLSVVQTNTAGFVPGERVVVVPGGPARLLPLASVSPAS